MSFGERSCKHFAVDCPKNWSNPTMLNMPDCSVNCDCYEYDGKTKPDTHIITKKRNRK